MQELLWIAPERPPPQKKGRGGATSAGNEVTSGAVEEDALEDDNASSPLGEMGHESAR